MASKAKSQIPIVDIFAGPGGLGEGFSTYTDGRGHRPFKIAISVEKEPNAHKTLLLRSFYRQFLGDVPPDEFYQHLRGETDYDEFLTKIQDTEEGRNAILEARQHELSKDPAKDAELSKEIAAKIGNQDCILIGGPPCQPFSKAGYWVQFTKWP